MHRIWHFDAQFSRCCSPWPLLNPAHVDTVTAVTCIRPANRKQFLNITMHGSVSKAVVESRPPSGHLLTQPRQRGSRARSVWVNQAHMVHESNSFGDAQRCTVIPVAACEGWRSLEGRSSRAQVFRTKPVGCSDRSGCLSGAAG
jgi:hypothetical protein